MTGLVQIGSVVLVRKIVKSRQCILTLSLLSPLKKGVVPLIELESHLPNKKLCVFAGDIFLVILVKNPVQSRQLFLHAPS